MAKKNQHYIPQFYLRYFSFEQNQKEIGIYNLRNKFFRKNVALRDQCSKKYFYGRDEVIENFLSKIEGNFSRTIINIIEKESIKKNDPKEIYDLLNFVLFTDLRNPVSIDSLKEFPNKVRDLDMNLNIPELEHLESVKITLSIVKDILPFMFDLDYKLLKNNTSIPFISSDFPIAKYNLLYEKIPTYFSVQGYRSKGLLIFLPLNPALTIIFFDNSTYKIGNKKDYIVNISDEKEINQLNLLQLLNGNETVFFNECITEKYISNIHQLSKKYQRANDRITFASDFQRANGFLEKKSLIVSRNLDTFINLKIHSLKIHSGNTKNIDPTRINLRN